MKCRLAGAAAALLWILAGIALVIRLTAGNGGLLAAEMLRAAPPEVSGLPAEEYPGVGDMTASYLTGGTETFQYTLPDGTECFQPHEVAHMADCRGLIRLDIRVCIVCTVSAAALTAFGLLRAAGRKGFLWGILWGLRTAGIIAAVLLAWGLVNFSGLFVTFHRVAFPNGGWVLNSGTDLLMRLMPLKFFIRLGVYGLLWSLAVPTVLEAGARIALYRVDE